MSKYEAKHEYSGKSVTDVYQAGLRTVQAAGYRLVKKRDIASLAICEAVIDGNRVELNLMVPLGKPTTVLLNLSSANSGEPALKQEADRVLGLLGDELGIK